MAFGRPGYGGSTATAFSVGSVARMALQAADRYGLERFRTSGWSGGGPFAVATAAVAGERVQAVGVIAGAAPFQLVAGALDLLSDGDRAAERLLPGDPEGRVPPLWRGTEDRMSTPSHGVWFAENLPYGRLTMRAGEGHLQAFAHLKEMLVDLMTA